ncbi:MAG: hypothetical protein OEW90_01810 [Betaproteobacteria bacterium]|nr:hypothetical protein [Betaproteobacteria bacterium]MDH4322855.1 hypothetical protein [Betaproteobacteria bacterium]MDH5210101.1 hypothetical protein [Betaproteobacteria bacterium]
MKREDALTLAKVAGYHNDSRSFTRLIIEQRVNRATMNRAWHAGTNARAAGVLCDCRECRPTP